MNLIMHIFTFFSAFIFLLAFPINQKVQALTNQLAVDQKVVTSLNAEAYDRRRSTLKSLKGKTITAHNRGVYEPQVSLNIAADAGHVDARIIILEQYLERQQGVGELLQGWFQDPYFLATRHLLKLGQLLNYHQKPRQALYYLNEALDRGVSEAILEIASICIADHELDLKTIEASYGLDKMDLSKKSEVLYKLAKALEQFASNQKDYTTAAIYYHTATRMGHTQAKASLYQLILSSKLKYCLDSDSLQITPVSTESNGRVFNFPKEKEYSPLTTRETKLSALHLAAKRQVLDELLQTRGEEDSSKIEFISVNTAANSKNLIPRKVSMTELKGTQGELDFEFDNSDKVLTFSSQTKEQNLPTEGSYDREKNYQMGLEYAQVDSEKSILYMRNSANLGYAPAQNYLALMYSSGFSQSKNYEQAYYWAKQSAQSQDAQGLRILESLENIMRAGLR